MPAPADHHATSRRPPPQVSHGRAGAGNPAGGSKAGFTLVELLVAATLALVAMAAVASLFGTFGRSVSRSQTLVEVCG